MDQKFIDAKKRLRETVDDHFEYDQWKIGEGTYGVVYKARRKDREDSREYALKKIKGTEAEGLSLSSCREISILRELRHDNVVCIEEVYLNPFTRDVWLLFEYAEYDLYQILQHHRSKGTNKQPMLLPDRMVRSLMHQIFLGMQYLHDNWILHRDLKPANILVMGDGPERGKVKIADLGMARLFHCPLKALSEVDPVVVTIWYRAPELLLGTKHYTKAVDQWALGCIFAELMTTKPIFRGHQVEDKSSKPPFQKDQLEKIFQVMGIPTEKTWPGIGLLPEYNKLRDFKAGQYGTGLDNCIKHTYMVNSSAFSDLSYHLLNQVLVMDPGKRMTCKHALEHDYFKNIIIDKDAFASMSSPYPTRAFDEKKPKVVSGGQRTSSAHPPPAPYSQTQPRSVHMQQQLGVHPQHRSHHSQQQQHRNVKPSHVQQHMLQQRPNISNTRPGAGPNQPRNNKSLGVPDHQTNQHY